MQTRRTRAYWPTRIMLAFAIVGPPAVLFWLIAMQPGMMGPMYAGSPWLGPGGAILAFGVCLWIIGVIWMIRIFRGPSDTPPPWRYRGR